MFFKHIHPFVFYRGFVFPNLYLFDQVSVSFLSSSNSVFLVQSNFCFQILFLFFHIISVKNYAALNLRERVYFNKMKITLDVKNAYFEIESLMFFCK